METVNSHGSSLGGGVVGVSGSGGDLLVGNSGVVVSVKTKEYLLLRWLVVVVAGVLTVGVFVVDTTCNLTEIVVALEVKSH